ncbi:Holliday junction resolvase RuvX [Mycoplasmoides alvi]|uniref:Holliday junction resolvase RuvX n=1 Tax=Mycoplasmoides alvi TaxID=78580 RepID=UPI00051BCB21|nr:Holliday junction resolvase RuvX [Mycoplasmoides alvi]
MYFVGLDVGSKTIGIAICNNINGIPSPLTTIKFNSNNYVQAVALLRKKLSFYFNENLIFIIGWPVNKDGSLNNATLRVEQFILELKKQIPKCEYKLQNEQYTTQFANELLFEMNIKSSLRSKNVDKVSALIILEMFLNENK